MTDNGAPAPRDVLRIRLLNDAARKKLEGVVLTHGVASLPPEIVVEIAKAVAAFDDFHPETNDPWGEHDFGSLTVMGYHIFWKVDVYDLELKFASPDPADPEKSRRSICVMLASDW